MAQYVPYDRVNSGICSIGVLVDTDDGIINGVARLAEQDEASYSIHSFTVV